MAASTSAFQLHLTPERMRRMKKDGTTRGLALLVAVSQALGEG